MKKKLSAITGMFALCVLLAGLGGCSDSTDGTNVIKNATKPVTMSQAFNSKSVWIVPNGDDLNNAMSDGGDLDNEDIEVDYVLVFDGKGNVTIYTFDWWDNDITVGDLEGLSEEEIIRLAKKEHKNFLTRLTQEFRDCDEHFADEFYDAYGMTCDEAAQKYESVEYQEPKPVSFQLTIITDENGILGEAFEPTFSYAHSYYGLGRYKNERLVMLFSSELMEKSKPVRPLVMNNTYYDGYVADGHAHLTAVPKNHPGFVFDTPGTKGVNVETEEEIGKRYGLK